MLKIIDAVRQIVNSSDVLSEGMRQRILNFSALAQQIQPEVERKTFKSVKSETIVVALSRIAKEERATVRPKVKIDDLSIKTSVCDISFDKTNHTLDRLSLLHQTVRPARNDFFTTTQGVDEITIVTSQEHMASVLNHMQVEPKSIYENMSALIVRFGEKYLDVPNTIYVLLAVLAAQKINLVEIISTYTELTIIVEKKESKKAFTAWSELLSGDSNEA